MLAGSATRTRYATPTVISWQPVGSDGEPATVDPGTVTVGVVRADLSEVVAAGTTTGGSGTAARTYTLTVADTALLDILTATWKVGTTTVAVTRHEIVGGYYFTAADLRNAEPSLNDSSRDTVAKVLAARAEVETFFESVCGCSFVPRFSLLRGYVGCSFVPRFSLLRGYVGESYDWGGNTTVVLPPFLREVVWARYWSEGSVTHTVLTGDELAAIAINDTGIVSVPYGNNLYEIGCTHGADRPPSDIRAAAMTYARTIANRPRSGVPDRAVSMSSPDGMSFQLGRVGTSWRPTGIDAVDEVLRRPEYNFRLAGTIL